jgi:processive 1,2-diacylglycerol beta-glucosyltransferase/1,2-diacylglycerol 3-beta-galactosyltransferase
MDSHRSAERILLLYLPSGGGHKSNANAIAEHLVTEYAAETLVYDPVTPYSRLGHAILDGGYRFVSLRLPLFWKFLYVLNENTPVMNLCQFIAGLFARQGLMTIINDWQPTRIVCLHHLVTPTLRLVLADKPDLPVVVVATDPFVPSPIWANGHEYPILCFSHEAVATFMTRGVAAARLKAFSIIISERFMHRMPPAEIRAFKESCGFDPERPLVLVAGGGDGMRGAEHILARLGRSALDFQVALVCGRDTLTKGFCEVIAHGLRSKGRMVVVYGFTDRMYELMGSADAIVSKAGPSMLGEVLASGKPNLIAYFIPGQEEPNVRWVESRGIGFYCRNPKAVLDGVERLLSDYHFRARMESAITAVGFRNGLQDICAAIMHVETVFHLPAAAT